MREERCGVFVTHKRSRNLFGLQVEIVGKEEWSHDYQSLFCRESI